MSDIVTTAIDQARTESFQSRAKQGIGGGLWLVNWMANAGGVIPAWWSPSRDAKLREFWKKSDHLSGAVYTMESKMTSIPNRVVARDQSIKEHVKQADRLTAFIQSAAEFGGGWGEFYAKFVEDLLCTDNGAFAEIIGAGDPTGPIIGQPISVAHLDSYRCQRTGDPQYPILYHDLDGKTYKLHFTRVMFTAQMSSPIAEMYGVGYCPVSRCINVAQTLIDILTFKQEKLGSRPHRAIILTQGGLDPKDLQDAFNIAESHMDDQLLSRYSKVIIGGSSSMPEADMKMFELSQLPDGFNEQTSITLGMATIALAFGVDARELFPALTSGTTQADALLQHLKQRGKGPGQILQATEQLFNYKFLPQHLKFEFDFQDDAQDRQVAEIHQIRSNTRRQDVDSRVADVRTARENALKDGDIDRGQFDRLELDDGRLPDGTDVVALFFSDDRFVKPLVDLGVKDPTDLEANSPEKMIPLINKKISENNTILVNSTSPEKRWGATQANAALKALKELYEPQGQNDMLQQAAEQQPSTTFTTQAKNPATRSVDRRVRQENPASPDNKPEQAAQGRENQPVHNAGG